MKTTKRMRNTVLIVIGIAALSVALALVVASRMGTRALQRSASSTPPRNLLIMVVDTLRTDVLESYGSAVDCAPHLSRFARRAVIFENAWVQSTYTQASVISYLTSPYVRSHGWDYPVPGNHPKNGICGRPDLVTLAQVLEKNGFINAAFSANNFLHPKLGFALGFREWNKMDVGGLKSRRIKRKDLPRVRPDGAARKMIERWKDDERYFVYMHLMEPHLPLKPSLKARRVFGVPAEPAVMEVADMKRIEKTGTPEEKKLLRDLYRAAVWEQDRRTFAMIMKTLSRTGHADDTIVVFTADHGEKIWEHGDYGHADRVWEQLVHVPLLIRAPGLEPRRISRPVALLDLAPTLLRMLGVGPKPASWQGGDLFEHRGEPRALFSERLGEVTVTLDGRYKAIRSPEGEWRLYDLSKDRTEQLALTDSKEILEGLRGEYRRWTEKYPEKKFNSKRKPVGICGYLSEEEDEEQTKALKALGYLE